MARKKDNVETSSKIIDLIKSKTLGVDSKDTLSTIDQSIARISDTVVNKDSANYAEMIRSLFGDILSDKFNSQTMTETVIQNYLATDRFGRYTNSEEIVDCIAYCSRALSVLSDEITAPDEITKVILQFISNGDSDIVKKELEQLKVINKTLSVDDYVRDIVYETLKYGDHFIEICDYKERDVPLTQTLLNENTINPFLKKEEIFDLQKISENNEYEISVDKTSAPNILTEDLNIKLKLVVEETSAKASRELEDIRLIFHDPRYVIKLQSEKFKMCLGYLILPKFSTDGSPQRAFTNTNSLMSLMGTGLGYKNILGIDNLYLDIMKIIKNKLSREDVKLPPKKEVKDMLIRSIAEIENEDRGEFKIRFVPSDRMEHFTINPRRFFPYGESIFYKTTFSSKLLIALESAITVKRITDSSDKRIMYVETGLPRDSKSMIDSVKESMKKRRISVDKFGNISSIPTMITNYEDYYIPQYNGKKYLEFDQLPSTVSVRDSHEELKYFRDQLVSSLEVPPSYIGLEENLCLKLDTRIIINDGRHLTLQEIIDEFEQGKQLKVISCVNGIMFSNTIKWAGKTRLDTNLVRVHLSCNSYVDCTPDHPFLLADCKTYVEAKNLQPNDELMETGSVKIHCVEVEELSGTYDTGDITLEHIHNFALESGVFVHNSNKAALTFENILFARTVVSYQTIISKGLMKLFSKLHKFIYKEKLSGNVRITLSPPKMLENEKNSENFRICADIINSLKDLGIDQEYLKKKYLPLDWSELEEYEVKSNIEKKLETKTDEEGGAGSGYPGY